MATDTAALTQKVRFPSGASLALGTDAARVEGCPVQLRVCPIALGRGRSLFTYDTAALELRLLEAKAYDSGIVSLRYDI
jgi:hypothetical protein